MSLGTVPIFASSLPQVWQGPRREQKHGLSCKDLEASNNLDCLGGLQGPGWETLTGETKYNYKNTKTEA